MVSVQEYRPDSLSLTFGCVKPCTIAVDAEPSSTSAFQGLVRIVATTTKIGTGSRFGSRSDLLHADHHVPQLAAPLIERAHCGEAWVVTLEYPPFSGQVAAAGELLHTSWRVLTFVATVLLSGAIDTFL